MAASLKLGGGLSLRARHFAEIYDGNGYQSALKAGFSKKNAKNRACELLDDEMVQAIIRARELKRVNGDIMTREERQRWWTDIVRDETRPLPERLKAIEHLARSEGDFLERSEVDHRLPSILPEGLDKESLIFIARGGLRAAAGAASPAPKAGSERDDDDDDDAPGPTSG